MAYGKLGGKELGYASDLDLIFLYDDDHPDAEKIYIRFARRLMNWLTVTTSSGVLFDIDMRLRPNGESGMLVSSLDAYKNMAEKRGRYRCLALGASSVNARTFFCR